MAYILQILLDVVSVFNMVSSLSQKKQSVKINHEGVEVSPSLVWKLLSMQFDPRFLFYLFFITIITISIWNIIFFAQLLQVFREFYPMQVDFITLDCVWKTDKFELVERTHKSQIASPGVDLSLGTSSVLYKSTDSSLGGQCIYHHSYFIFSTYKHMAFSVILVCTSQCPFLFLPLALFYIWGDICPICFSTCISLVDV